VLAGTRVLDLSINVLKRDNTVFGISVFGRDITERKQLEQTLQEYNARLEMQVEARTRELRQAQEQLVRQEKLAVLGRIAGSVSHELRNPLGVINNSIYYLEVVQPEAGEKIRHHHAMIRQEVRNAEKIIDDLLDFVRTITAEREQVSVRRLVKMALERTQVPADIEVTIELADDLPEVFVDPGQVAQVLGNLVLNACQATGAGGKLTFSARQEKDIVLVAVKDTGEGIPPENMSKLFEPLFTTRVTGIGLGLPICRKLAEANGGRIEVESEVGKGSTFTLFLPVQGISNE
jgi:signal transduction histidine kinase